MKTKAKDLMSLDVLKAVEGISVEEAVRLLVKNKVTGVPVVNEKGKMVGVLSEYDLIQQLSKQKKDQFEFKKPAKFSKKVRKIKAQASLNEVLKLFISSRFRRLPVVDAKDKLVGIITRRDIMRMYYYRSRLGG